jgi:diguanylate cyclase (GGDEF)-like protein
MSTTPAAKVKILVVINQSEDATLIRYALQKCGYKLYEAGTAALALQLITNHQPDLVLLDLNAVSVGQDDLLEYLRQHQVPTILITSETPGKEIKKFLTYTKTYTNLDHIQRPIDAIGLVLRVKSSLRQKEVLAELELIRRKLEKNNRKLKECTIFDDATGVVNHAYLANQVKLEFARGVRHNSPLAFLLVEIPYLRQINEDYGPETRDKLLREIAQLIKEQLRFTDMIGRYGKNQFGILLPETDLMAAKLVADKICQAVNKHSFSPFVSGETQEGEKVSDSETPSLKLDVYVGLSAYPDKRVAHHEELIEAARKSLSLVKEQDSPPAYLCGSCPGSQVVGIKS